MTGRTMSSDCCVPANGRRRSAFHNFHDQQITWSSTNIARSSDHLGECELEFCQCYVPFFIFHDISYRFTNDQLTPSPSTTSTSSSLRTQSPIILTRKLVMQRLDPFCLLPFAQFLCASDLEERRCCLDQPLRLDHADHVHVFLRRLHERMVNDMLSRLAKESRGWV